MRYESDQMNKKIQTEAQRIQDFKHDKEMQRQKKKLQIFSAEQKRSDMRTAFYHMAVWNVRDTKEVVDHLVTDQSPFSISEQVRNIASDIRIRKKHGTS
jgi:hypothetical protein